MKGSISIEELTLYIEKKGRIMTKDITGLFGVSIPTVHKFLNQLSNEGIIKRIHGGAIFLDNKEESLFDKKLKLQSKQKKSMCRYVAQHFIEEEAVIGIDSGTTAFHLVEYINVKNLTIVSNGLKIASHAAQVLPYANVLCSGGTVRPQLSVCVGNEAINFFRDKRINVLVLTCSGIDLNKNIIYEVDMLIAEVKRVMMSKSSKVVLMVTSDKMDNPSLSYLSDISSVHDIVCDDGISDEVLEMYHRRGNRQRIHIVPTLQL